MASQHQMRVPAPGTSWSRSIEDRSMERLLNHLRLRGHSAELCGQPDRQNRTGRAVDAELRIDGRLVGVEITRLHPVARALSEMARLEHGLQSPLEKRVRERNLGYVLLSLECRQLPTKREIFAATPTLQKDIEAAMGHLDPSPVSRRTIPVDTGVRFVRTLDLIQLPDMGDQVQWLVGSDETGGDLETTADDFVSHLLDTKATQADGYTEAWLVVVDITGLVGPDLLSRALAGQRTHIPNNWTRIWYLPATDLMAVLELNLG
jgi:hypothetical protein